MNISMKNFCLFWGFSKGSMVMFTMSSNAHTSWDRTGDVRSRHEMREQVGVEWNRTRLGEQYRTGQ